MFPILSCLPSGLIYRRPLNKNLPNLRLLLITMVTRGGGGGGDGLMGAFFYSLINLLLSKLLTFWVFRGCPLTLFMLGSFGTIQAHLFVAQLQPNLA